MFSMYVIAICLTVAELVVGIFAIFSRWGSLVTTIVSTVSNAYALTLQNLTNWFRRPKLSSSSLLQPLRPPFTSPSSAFSNLS